MKYKNLIQMKYYNNVFYLLQQNIIGKLIKKGKKIVALNIWFELKKLLKFKIKKESSLIILVSLLNSLVKVHFIKKRFGSVKKDIPVFLKFEKQIKFAIKSFLDLSVTKKGIFINKLINLICYTFKKKGPIIKKKNLLYKKAMDNKVLLSFIKK
jgi:ribosomal protein S7